MVTSHTQSLSNLTASTPYHYRVKSTDAAGHQAVSGDYVFTTKTIPIVTSVIPDFAPAGGEDFTLTVNGSNFNSSSQVQWNGDYKPTHYSTPSLLYADIGTSDIASVGTASVTVFNLDGGGSSGSATFRILTTQAPAITSAYAYPNLIRLYFAPSLYTNGFYEIERITVFSDGSTGSASTFWTGSTSSSWEDNSVAANTTYQYCIRVTKTSQTELPLSGWSNWFEVTTPPAPPPTPTVKTVDPPSGLASGGIRVTIIGTNFDLNASVKFGNNFSTGVRVENSNYIIAKAPSGVAGQTVEVKVTNPSGQFGTGSFTYSECSKTLSPVENSIPSAGGSGSFSVNAAVNAEQGCPWTATSDNNNWITITGGSIGSGNGTVSYSVVSNASVARTGTITISNNPNAVYPQPTSLIYSSNIGFAGIDSYSVMVGNGGGMTVDILYDFTPWEASTVSDSNQVETIGPMDSSGNLTHVLNQSALPGTYRATAIRNHLNMDWVPINPVSFTIRPAKPISFNEYLDEGFTFLVGNGQNQTELMNYTISYLDNTTQSGQELFCLDANGYWGVYLSPNFGIRMITFQSIRNSLDDESDAWFWVN
jgi:hypothetical protein